MTVYVVYSQFIDDPSIVRGIFTSIEAAEEAYNQWDDKYKEIQEITLDEVLESPISLN